MQVMDVDFILDGGETEIVRGTVDCAAANSSAAFGDRFYVEGDYRLMNDNLLDLSHIQFLHASTLGAASDEDAEIAVDRHPDCVRVTRWVFDTEPAPFYKVMLGSDYPFPIGDMEPRKVVAECSLSKADKDKILEGHAQALFGI